VSVQQISVFVENREGRVASVTRTLADAGVNVRAMSMADAPDFGIFRFVVDDPPKAQEALRSGGFLIDTTELVAVEVPDRPGGLADVLAALAAASLNVEYMYAYQINNLGSAVILFRFEDPVAAARALRQAGSTIVEAIPC
jgi:hypothetical protein